jgi:signal transduction histidine kinase
MQAHPIQAQSAVLEHGNGDVLQARPRRQRRAGAIVAPKRITARSDRILADASKRLAASLGVDVTLRTMGEVGLPWLGEACLVFQMRDARTIESLVTSHVDPSGRELLSVLERAPDCEGWAPVCRCARQREPLVLSATSTSRLMAGDPERPRLVELLGFKSALMVPIAHETQTEAVAVFLSVRARRYGRSRVVLAAELADRFKLALRAARAHESWQERWRGREEQLATMAHDLIAPLAFVKGSAQFLLRLSPWGHPTAADQLRERLAAVDAATTRMAAMLHSLVHDAQESQAASASDDVTDLVAMIRGVIAQQQLAADGHTIRFLSEQPMVGGVWDAHQMEAMITNLVSNAVKYSSAGSVVDVTLTRAREAEATWAILRVTDQGIGIPAQDLPYVLQVFRRGSNVGRIPGSGIGLASAWQTAQRHGGQLWVESTEGRGTTVTVRLPMLDDPHAVRA